MKRKRKFKVDKDTWKIAGEYTAGFVVLAVVVAVAWFLPEWYGDWQDERMLGQVELSSREGIQFLDSDSLDIADRIKLLKDPASFSWGYEVFGIEWKDYADIYSSYTKTVSGWVDAGLLPKDCEEWSTPDQNVLIDSRYIQVGSTMFPVYILCFEDEESENSLVVLMDSELDLIYYASVCGPLMEDSMARELGYASYEALVLAYREGRYSGGTDGEIPVMDFAVPCGALEAQVDSVQGELEQEIVLQFETFSGQAWRKPVENNLGYGMAVIYGTELWADFMTDWFNQHDTIEYVVGTADVIAGMYMEYPADDFETGTGNVQF